MHRDRVRCLACQEVWWERCVPPRNHSCTDVFARRLMRSHIFAYWWHEERAECGERAGIPEAFRSQWRAKERYDLFADEFMRKVNEDWELRVQAARSKGDT